jgi:hypothetical protein
MFSTLIHLILINNRNNNKIITTTVPSEHISLAFCLISLLFTYLTPWPLVRKRTIPTERPPLVGEVSANFSG